MQQLWTVLSSCCITIILIFQPLIFTRGCWGKPSSSTDYDCDYHDYTLGTGKCYSCPYQESLTCFRSNVCVHYKNAVIYTVSGSDWDKYVFLFFWTLKATKCLIKVARTWLHHHPRWRHCFSWKRRTSNEGRRPLSHHRPGRQNDPSRPT